MRGVFSILDWCLFLASLLVCTAIGIYHACCGEKQTSAQQVLLANRKLTILPVAMSMLANFLSAISILGYPVEIYTFGTMFCYYALTYCIVFPAAAFLFVPVFHELHLTSAYEYLERRFNKAVRFVASLTFVLQSVLYMAVVLYAPALAISSVTNIPLEAAVVVTGVVGTFYTTIGGAKAVVWTSTFQIVLVLIGLLAVIISGCMQVGGLVQVFEIASNSGRIDFTDFRPDPRVRHSFWSLVVGGTFTILPLFAAHQMTIQRYISIEKLRSAQIAMLLNLPTNWVALTLYTLAGVVMFASFSGCDPKKAGLIERSDQLLPYFVMNQLRIDGLPGLFVAALYGAGLSTLAGGCNALSAVVFEDFVKPIFSLRGKEISAKGGAWTAKFISFCFGFGCIGVAFLFKLTAPTVLQIALSIFGMVGGPILGVFCLGIFVPYCNSKGALAGQIISLLCTFWVGLGALACKIHAQPLPSSTDACEARNVTDFLLHNTTIQAAHKISCGEISEFYRLSYQYYSLFGIIVLFVVAMCVSLVTGLNKVESVDPALLSPLWRKFLSPSTQICLVNPEQKQSEKEITDSLLEDGENTCSQRAVIIDSRNV